MSTFVFYADQQHKMRADGRNTVIAEGADANAARLIGEALLGSPGALAKFAVVDISASFPAFGSEEHTSELQSLMRMSYAVFCLKKKKRTNNTTTNICPHRLQNKTNSKTV